MRIRSQILISVSFNRNVGNRDRWRLEAGNPSGDWAAQMLASHADNATPQEFISIINDLEPDQQQEVVALLWLERGDFFPC